MNCTARCICAHEGCTDGITYSYASVRERREADVYYAKRPYRCIRHAKPNEVLSPKDLERTTEFVNGRSITYPELDDLFWNDGGSFEYGPGFKAFAKDFPIGTKLIITARIELP
jgi:hypothetical protein